MSIKKVNSVSVNIEKSREIGQIVGQLHFKDSFLDREFLSLQVADETKAAMYYYAVGICHQTYHLGNKKLNLFGWDFLEYGFIEIAKSRPNILNAHFLVQLSPAELIPLIQPFFAEDHQVEKCTLDQLEERASLWLEMADFLVKSKTNILQFIKNSNQKAVYFYQNLPNTEAYSDPLQKKTSFLIKLLEDASLLKISDPEKLIPIMDYHMQRVLLRTGCIEIVDDYLHKKLQNRTHIKSDLEIREACIAAIKIIAESSTLSVLKMNDVFYTMGRSCCNEKMLCQTHTCEKSPCTLTLAVELPSHKTCIFQDICMGAINSEYRKYWQPQVQTHFY